MKVIKARKLKPPSLKQYSSSPGIMRMNIVEVREKLSAENVSCYYLKKYQTKYKIRALKKKTQDRSISISANLLLSNLQKSNCFRYFQQINDAVTALRHSHKLFAAILRIRNLSLRPFFVCEVLIFQQMLPFLKTHVSICQPT